MINRRLFIIIVPVLLLLIGAGSVLFLRFRKPATPSPPPPAAVLAPAQGVGKLKLLSDDSIISVKPSVSGEAVWYMNAAGVLYRLDLVTLQKEVFGFPESLKDPIFLQWQNSGSDLLISENIGGHERVKYYDAIGRKFVQYAEQIRNPVFLAGNQQVAYDWVSMPAKSKTPKHELKVSDMDGRNFRKIGDLFQPDYILTASPVKQELVMHSRSEAPLVLVDLATGKFQTIDEAAAYTGVKFSPDGSRILVSVRSDAGAEKLLIYDLADFKKTALDFAQLEFGAAVFSADSRKLSYAAAEGVYEIDLSDLTVSERYAFSEPEKISPRQVIAKQNSSELFIIDETGALFLLQMSDSG